ncbi:MAG TPA: hypothetical protein VF538_05460 [Pyrinomonadaceae bacterium]|jgi:hypothetical protein
MKTLTRRLLIATLTFFIGLTSAWLVHYYISHKQAQTPKSATGVPTGGHQIRFEGTLLKYSPHAGVDCGVFYIHQVAKYRVENILSGGYAAGEIIVDHPACRGDVFKNIPVGSRVNVTVSVRETYNVITRHPGIREEERPTIFYVADVPPEKIDSNQ